MAKFNNAANASGHEVACIDALSLKQNGQETWQRVGDARWLTPCFTPENSGIIRTDGVQ